MASDDATTEATDEWIRIRLRRGEWFFDPQRPLGKPGGFGDVFEGTDASGQRLAVKRLKISAADAAHRELRIADEFVGKPFKHVMTVLDSGEDASTGRYYLVMARADRSLEEALRYRRTFPLEQALNILEQIGEGLAEVPELVHRDLKPGNVLFHEGSWKIADFGIARFAEEATATQTLSMWWSPPYAAPEVWLGDRATRATDIYALACVAYALIRGAPPFSGPRYEDYKRQHTTDKAPSLSDDIDDRVRSILSSALRKGPDGRPSLSSVS